MCFAFAQSQSSGILGRWIIQASARESGFINAASFLLSSYEGPEGTPFFKYADELAENLHGLEKNTFGFPCASGARRA